MARRNTNSDLDLLLGGGETKSTRKRKTTPAPNGPVAGNPSGPAMAGGPSGPAMSGGPSGPAMSGGPSGSGVKPRVFPQPSPCLCNSHASRGLNHFHILHSCHPNHPFSPNAVTATNAYSEIIPIRLVHNRGGLIRAKAWAWVRLTIGFSK